MNPLAFLGFGGLITGLFLFMRRAKGAIKMHGKEERLGKNFKLGEFLTSGVLPDLINMKVPELVWNNLLRLVTLVLQPARDLFGPLRVTNGWRPEGVVKDGKTFNDLLKEKGYKPSATSDHPFGLAADVVPAIADTTDRTKKGIALYQHFKTSPNVRQVILYLKTSDNGFVITHVHVAIKAKMREKISPLNRAFVMIDGKRSDAEPA